MKKHVLFVMLVIVLLLGVPAKESNAESIQSISEDGMFIIEKMVHPDGSIEHTYTSILDYEEDGETFDRTIQSTYTASSLQEIQNAAKDIFVNFKSSATVQIQGNFTSKQIFDAVNAIYHNLRDIDDYAYANAKKTSYNLNSKGNSHTLTITSLYHADATEQAYITKRVKEIIAQIIKPNMTDLEKVMAVNDYIALNTRYNKQSNGNPHSAYTILTKGEGVCQAYAALAQRFFDLIGIESHYVVGDAGGGPHGWNLVRVDGAWYHLDITWNDPTLSDATISPYKFNYKYFLVTDAQISKDHKISSNDKNLPKATSNRFVAFQSVTTPTRVGNELYFPNANDSNKLYKINTRETTPRAVKVLDLSVDFPLYANDGIYFKNLSNKNVLSKLNLATGKVETLTNKPITHVRQLQGKLYGMASATTYSYIEDIQAGPSQPSPTPGGNGSTNNTVSTNIKQIIEQIDALDANKYYYLEDFYIVSEQVDKLKKSDLNKVTNLKLYKEHTATVKEIIQIANQLDQRIVKLDALEGEDESILIEEVYQLRLNIEEYVVSVQRYMDHLEDFESLENYYLSTLDPSHYDNFFYYHFIYIVSKFEYYREDFIKNGERVELMVEQMGDYRYKLFDVEENELMDNILNAYNQMNEFGSKDYNEMADFKTLKTATEAVTFTLPNAPKNTQVNKKYIKLLDMFGHAVNAEVKINGKKVTVIPLEPLEPNIHYLIVVEKGLTFSNNSKLKKGQYMGVIFARVQ